MSEFLAAIGLKVVALVGGFMGAVISLKFIEGLTKSQRMTAVLAGTLAAAYSTPITLELFDLSAKVEGSVAFLGGLFGMSIAGALIKALPEWVAAARNKFLGS